MTQELEIKYVSKLSMKNAGVDPRKVLAADGDKASVVLARIFGLADGIKQVEDKTNATVHLALTGKFQSINAQNGQITRSGILYLPKGIHEVVMNAVKQLEEGSVVRFGLEVRSVKASNPIGYSYEAIDLLPVQEKDPLSELADVIAKKQLPAPASAQEKDSKKK